MGNPFKNSAGSAPKLQKTFNKIGQGYSTLLPQINATNNANIVDSANAELKAAQQVQPGYNALNLQQLQQYALPTTAIQQQIADSNAQQGAQTNLNLLRGTGGEAANAAMALSRQTNPNYWATQDNASRQANNLLNSINMNGLSPGEQNAMERGANQGMSGTGNLGLNNNTNTLANAMNFGGAFNTKQALLGNALNAANQTSQSALNNGVNPIGIAMGTGQTNQGNVASFQNPQYSTANAGQTGNQLLSILGGQANTWQPLQANASQQNSAAGMFATNSAACCFIFLESYNGVLPWYVRVERDKYYQQEPRIASGYKRMAKWLVPLMRRFKSVRAIVNITMVKPLTWYGGHTHKVNSFGHVFWPVKKAWFTIWKLQG